MTEAEQEQKNTRVLAALDVALPDVQPTADTLCEPGDRGLPHALLSAADEIEGEITSLRLSRRYNDSMPVRAGARSREAEVLSLMERVRSILL